jgi:hypothetical protein
MASNLPPGRPKQNIGIRMDTATKERLTQLAKAENISLKDYIQKYYTQLINSGQIQTDEEITIPNPNLNNPPPYNPQPYYPGTVPGQPVYYPQQPQYYPQPQQQAPQLPLGELDLMLADFRKMYMVNMMARLMEGKENMKEVYEAATGKAAGAKEEFTMNDMMKFQMMQQTMAAQQAQAERQLENARSHGDKAGENQALQLITALATSSNQQSQNFMTQFMTAMQMQQGTQTAMFQTALSTGRQSDDAARQERNQFSNEINNVRTQMTNVQMTALQESAKMQMGFMQTELERIRNEPKKDVIAQMGELLTMRNTNPVYKAAFDAAFGVKDEGGIGGMIPKLKELGVDKIIDTVVKVASGFLTRPPQEGAGAIPAPDQSMPQQYPMPVAVPESAVMPPPMAVPTAEELSNLRLPKGDRGLVVEPEVPAVNEEEVPEAGYNNLNRPQSENVDLSRQAADASPSVEGETLGPPKKDRTLPSP